MCKTQFIGSSVGEGKTYRISTAHILHYCWFSVVTIHHLAVVTIHNTINTIDPQHFSVWHFFQFFSTSIYKLSHGTRAIHHIKRNHVHLQLRGQFHLRYCYFLVGGVSPNSIIRPPNQRQVDTLQLLVVEGSISAIRWVTQH